MGTTHLIYKLVAAIPQGKVSTYGAVVRGVGIKSSRFVGLTLHGNKDPKSVPCHRVIRSDGKIAENFAFGGKAGQESRLTAEGVTVKSGRVDLREFLWEPSGLVRLFIKLLDNADS